MVSRYIANNRRHPFQGARPPVILVTDSSVKQRYVAPMLRFSKAVAILLVLLVACASFGTNLCIGCVSHAAVTLHDACAAHSSTAILHSVSCCSSKGSLSEQFLQKTDQGIADLGITGLAVHARPALRATSRVITVRTDSERPSGTPLHKLLCTFLI